MCLSAVWDKAQSYENGRPFAVTKTDSKCYRWQNDTQQIFSLIGNLCPVFVGVMQTPRNTNDQAFSTNNRPDLSSQRTDFRILNECVGLALFVYQQI